MGFGLRRSVVASVLLVAVALPSAPAALAADTDAATAAHEVAVVTVNAKQREGDAARQDELANAISRLEYAPDAILIQEITAAPLQSLRDKLNERMNATYGVVGVTSSEAGNVKVKILLNTSTMRSRKTVTWNDTCDANRIYQLVEAEEVATGAPVGIAGVHFAPMDDPAGSDECKKRNADEVRRVMAPYDATGSIVGDFNRRAMTLEYECDPEETSAPLPWYTAITEPKDTGYSYVDTVRAWHRLNGLSMGDQWTFEKATAETRCDDTVDERRMRIDYIFASSTVTTLKATVDNPGWAGTEPGVLGCSPQPACKYSDHRFVWAHLRLPVASAPDITAPAAPTGLAATQGAADGTIELDWADNTDDATSYRLFRSVDGVVWAAVAATSTSAFTDTGLAASTTYTYRVTAVDAAGNESEPSAPASATTAALASTLHVGDIDRSSSRTGKTWSARATITAHDNRERVVSGASVAVRWSNGATRTCTTGTSGACTVSVDKLSSATTSVTAEVRSLAIAGLTYAPTDNHDPDGDSTGTTITVIKP